MARMSALVRMRIVKVDNGVRGKNNDEFFFFSYQLIYVDSRKIV